MNPAVDPVDTSNIHSPVRIQDLESTMGSSISPKIYRFPKGCDCGLSQRFLLKFVHVNLNSLTNKLSKVSASMTTHTIDFLGTFEFLCVFIPGYEIARSDTLGGSREHSVAAYIRKPSNNFVT